MWPAHALLVIPSHTLVGDVSGAPHEQAAYSGCYPGVHTVYIHIRYRRRPVGPQARDVRYDMVISFAKLLFSCRAHRNGVSWCAAPPVRAAHFRAGPRLRRACALGGARCEIIVDCVFSVQFSYSKTPRWGKIQKRTRTRGDETDQDSTKARPYRASELKCEMCCVGLYSTGEIIVDSRLCGFSTVLGP